MDKIYLLTTIYIGNEPTHKDKSLIKHKRTVGWFSTLERAEDVIIHNEGDIHEAGHYDHCVIEEIQSGLYPHVSREEWFKWMRGRYVLVSKPEGLETVHNLGIG